MNPKYLSAEELSKKYPGVWPSAWVVRRRAREGYLPFVKMGRRYAFDLKMIEAHFKSLSTSTATGS